MAIPVLYMAHCFLNEDHWSGELPALMEGGFSFKLGGACVGVGGCTACTWVVSAVLRTVPRVAGKACDFHVQPVMGQSSWMSLMVISRGKERPSMGSTEDIAPMLKSVR